MEEHKSLSRLIFEHKGEVVEQPGDAKCYHVLPLFTQPDVETEFAQYQKDKLPIIGPPCVRDAVEKGIVLPAQEDVRRSPRYSHIMIGAIICSTGLTADIRGSLIQRVRFMGGVWHMDLTSSVTHMLATAPGTEKYKVAVQRGRPAIVLPGWVSESWNQQTLLPLEQFPVPPFTGLMITVTGLPHGQREKIERLCTQYGGEYSRDLNKHCTHLIVERPGSKKHKYAQLWGTVVAVNSKWFFDSVEKKACLEEKNYPPVALDDSQSQNSQQPDSSGTVDSQSQDEPPPKRALRRSRSPVPNASENVPAKRPRNEPLPTSNRLTVEDTEERKHTPINLTASRQQKTTTQASTTQNSPYTLCSRDTLAGDGVLHVAGFTGMDTESILATLPPLSYSPYDSPSLFKGISFLCKGFDSPEERASIKKLLEDHGGTVIFDNPNSTAPVVPAAGTYILYILAPHGTPGVTPLEGHNPTDIMVTPQWVQRCIQAEKVLNPMDMPALFQPLPHPLPLPKPPLDYLISVSGFAGEERDNIKALIEALGFQHSERFSKKNTHLICKEPEGFKFQKAREWQTGAIVKVDWLLQSALKGKIQDTKRYVSNQDAGIIEATKKFEERQKNQARFNKRSREKIIVIPEPKTHKERPAKRRSAASAASTTTTTTMTTVSYSHSAVKMEPSEPFLSEVTILVCKKLEQQQSMLHDLVASMGGSFAYMFDPSITHLIFEGRADSSKELRLAKAHKHIKIVSPMWLHACKRSNRKVDEGEYPHTMNPRMTLGLDFKSPAPTVKKEKRDSDYDTGLRASQPAVSVKREAKYEDDDSYLPFYGGFSQSQQPHHMHQDDRDEDLFVPPTQQPDSSSASFAAHTPSLPVLQHLVPELKRDKKNDQIPRGERNPDSERGSKEDVEREGDALTRRKRAKQDRTAREAAKPEESREEDSYDVIVGCTPDIRREGVRGVEAASMMVAKTTHQYFWQVKQEEVIETKSEREEGLPSEDTTTTNTTATEAESEEETKEEEEESEGSGHSAIIQQLLQKSKPATNGHMRISPLIRMQPTMKASIIESISRTVVRTDLNRSLNKFPTAIFKPPMTKDILPSQAEDEEEQSQASERRYGDEPDSQVVKYAYPLEQEAQDLLFSLAEESVETEGGTSAAESASERERHDNGRSSVKRKALASGDESKADLRGETKRRRSGADEAEDEAGSHKEAGEEKGEKEDNSNPWSSRGSGTSNRLSLEKSLIGKNYVFMFTAFTTTKPIPPAHHDIVRQLGGQVLDAKFFSRACTHVVMAEPTRTEKSLAACAAGIWLLKSSYLSECIEKNAFVDENNHVWSENDVSNEQAQNMIIANRRWRAEVIKRKQELQQAGKKGDELLRVGAYSGWRIVLIHSEAKRGEGLKRLIEAGGGEVFSQASAPVQTLTHAFFNERPDESSELVIALRRAKVPLLTTEYIGDFLTQHPLPQMDRYNFYSPSFAFSRSRRPASTAASSASASINLGSSTSSNHKAPSHRASTRK